MKISILLPVFLASAFIQPIAALADSITLNSLSAPPSTLNLSTGALAWAYYADTTASDFQAGNSGNSNPINPAPTTDALNLGGFTSFTSISGYPDKAPGGAPAISYVGGTGGANPAAETNATAFDFVQNSNSNGKFTITSTLFASSEKFNFYLLNYDTTSDLTASLNDLSTTTLALTNQVLGGGGDGSGGTQGVLSITVNGAIGQVLTFSDHANPAGVGSTAYGNTGIIAADVVAAPEPSAFLMYATGIAIMIGFTRLRGSMSR